MKKATLTRALCLLLTLLICVSSGLQLTASAVSTTTITQYNYWRFSDGCLTALCGFEGGADMHLECSGYRNTPMQAVRTVFHHEDHGQLCKESNCFFPHGEVTAYRDENGEYWFYEDRRSVQVTVSTDEADHPYGEMSFFYGGCNQEYETPGSYYSDFYQDYAVAADNEVSCDILHPDQMPQAPELPVDPQVQEYIPKDIIALAKAQLDNDGSQYWKWSNDAPGTPWCAIFVSWLADQCGYLNQVIPNFKLVGTGAEWFQARGQWLDGKETPRPGDIIFYNEPGYTYSHTGIVVKVANGRVHTIEGNTYWWNDPSYLVRSFEHRIGDSSITGYGRPHYWIAPILP